MYNVEQKQNWCGYQCTHNVLHKLLHHISAKIDEFWSDLWEIRGMDPNGRRF